MNERQRIVGPRHRCVTVEYFTCAVTAELGTKTVGEKPRAHVVAEYRHAVEIRVDRLAAECLECRFGTQITRRPIRFWINASQPSEHRTADAKRHETTHSLLGQVQPVTPVAAEIFIAAVAR